MIALKYGKRKIINYRGAKLVTGGLTSKNKIDILLQINKILVNSNNENKLFKNAISLCKEIFEADNVIIRIFNEKKGLLEVTSFMEENLTIFEPLNENQGIAGNVFHTQKSQIIKDIDFSSWKRDVHEDIQSLICVPIITREDIIGTLTIESKIKYFYKNDDLEILEAMAGELAMALTNVRLIERLIEERRKQEKLNNQLEFDLKMGRNVQSQIIQQGIKPWNSIHFEVLYYPMIQVSGDYYHITRKNNQITSIIVDVSGHGVPAALITMSIHHHFKNCIEKGLGLIEILEELSNSIKPILPEGVYFTAFILRIYGDYSFSYVNAGHTKLIQYHHQKDKFEEHDTEGLPIGLIDFNKKKYEEKLGLLEPGDLLLMLTDGMIEQKTNTGEQIGIEKILKWIRETRESGYYSNIKEIKDYILNNWNELVNETPISDDRTMILFYYDIQSLKARKLFEEARKNFKKGNLNIALDYGLKVYENDPSHLSNLLVLTQIFYKKNEWEKAISYMKEYLEISGEENATIHYNIGKLFFQLSQFQDAKKEFKNAIAIAPENNKYHLWLAKCYLKESHRHKALKILKNAITILPEDELLISAIKRLEKSIKNETKSI